MNHCSQEDDKSCGDLLAHRPVQRVVGTIRRLRCQNDLCAIFALCVFQGDQTLANVGTVMNVFKMDGPRHRLLGLHLQNTETHLLDSK